jgi:hypothetical protein
MLGMKSYQLNPVAPQCERVTENMKKIDESISEKVAYIRETAKACLIEAGNIDAELYGPKPTETGCDEGITPYCIEDTLTEIRSIVKRTYEMLLDIKEKL